MSENARKPQEPEEATKSEELDEEALDEVAGGSSTVLAGGGDLIAAFPDVCKTPRTADDPIAVPYPSLADSSDAGTTSTKTSSPLPTKKLL